MKQLILFLLLLPALLSGQIIERVPKSTTNSYGFIVVLPDGYKEQNKYPLLIHLHGVNGIGSGSADDLNKLVAGELPVELQRAAEKYKLIVIAPQAPGNWTNAETDHVLNWATSNLSINTKKIYLTGLSLGGGGVTRYVSASVANASKFAAAISVCGLNWISKAENIAAAKLPMIFFHAQDDATVPMSNTHNAVASINAYSMPVPVKKVVYPSGQHWIWGRVYDPDNRPWIDNEKPPTLYDWLLMNEQGKPVAVPVYESNMIAVAKATLEGNIVHLDGRQSAGFKSAGWSVVKAPAGVSIYDPIIIEGGGWITGKARLPKPGSYTFRLVIKDDRGAQATQDVTVNYSVSGDDNLPPPPVRTIKMRLYLEGKEIVIYSDWTVEVK